MLGKDLNSFPAARRKAQKQIQQARLIFSTCIGAGLGLLRNERFQDVVIDEASQQTEAASLVPLIKGAARAVLVGDHVQLRATVQPNAQALEHDVSLFERLWTEQNLQRDNGNGGSPIRCVMLNTQYRMHPDICAFPAKEFYQGKLLTATQCTNVPVPVSAFEWLRKGNRMVFIQTTSAEDLGRKSKANAGQAKVCQAVVRQLRSPARPPPTSMSTASVSEKSTQGTGPSPKSTAAPQPTAPIPALPSIAILTPYTRQAEALRLLLPNEQVSSIDAFQGQEADIIVYVTVRCNPHREIGFLNDTRRLNVALTRARAGLVVIGDEETLTGKKTAWNGEVGGLGGWIEAEDANEEEKWASSAHAVWQRLISGMRKMEWKLEGAVE